MTYKLLLSVCLVALLFSLNMGTNVSAVEEVEEAQEVIFYSPVVKPESVPVTVEEVEEKTLDEQADEILTGLVADFNERYGHNLSNPEIVFIDENNGKYYDSVIYIPKNTGKLNYTISHETCHYFQNKVARFEAFGESFCEVFAEANRSKDECSEKGWPEYYCSPFRLSEVDRQSFVDCVFEDIAYGGATREELLQCYNKNKI